MSRFSSASDRLDYEILSRVNYSQIQINICSWERFFAEVMNKEDYIKNVRDKFSNKNIPGIKTIDKKQKIKNNIERLKNWR